MGSSQNSAGKHGSDESYFYLTPPINHQDNRIWSQLQPVEELEKPFYKKIGLVCNFCDSNFLTILLQRNRK